MEEAVKLMKRAISCISTGVRDEEVLFDLIEFVRKNEQSRDVCWEFNELY